MFEDERGERFVRVVGRRPRPALGVLPSAEARAAMTAMAQYRTVAPKGVFRYPSHEAAHRAREAWETEAMLAVHQGGRVGPRAEERVARRVFVAVLVGGCAASPPAVPPPTAAPTAAAPAAAPVPAPREAAAPVPAGTAAPRGPAAPAPSLPPGCRSALELRCSGMAPRDGEPDEQTVVVCDECSANQDCTAAAQGRCVSVGGQRCAGPSRLVCRYGPPCDPRQRRDCPDRTPPPLPPSMRGE